MQPRGAHATRSALPQSKLRTKYRCHADDEGVGCTQATACGVALLCPRSIWRGVNSPPVRRRHASCHRTPLDGFVSQSSFARSPYLLRHSAALRLETRTRSCGFKCRNSLPLSIPRRAPTSTRSSILALAYEGLTRLDTNQETVPAAAESWEYNEDATQITFHLRDGLTVQRRLTTDGGELPLRGGAHLRPGDRR